MSDETPGVGQGALPPREGQGLRAMAERPAVSGTTVRVAQVVGGQYVLTTQSHGMPALTQISPANLTGNTNVARLISISPSRIGQTSPLRPSLANQSIVNVLTKARPNSNVRLQLFPSGESSGNNVQHVRSLKRPLSSTGEKKDTYTTKLQHVMNHRIVRSKLVKEKYNEHLLEAYYLETGNNILDLYQFAKRAKTQAYLAYLKEHAIDPREYLEVIVPQTTPSTPSATLASSLPGISHSSTVTTPDNTSNNSTPKSVSVKMKSTSLSSSTSQEMIVEKAKQEAYVVQRIADLQKEGLWSEKRLPKVQEMPRAKAHWDFLLEEMVWLAADFAQERKWKKAAAKKCARMVQKYFQDKALAAQKAEKAHDQNLRRIAAFCAKEIKNFWNNVEKLVEYKQNTILEEKRKKALDQQLSFIVDQTEKYSQLLAEGMNKTAEQPTSSAPSRSVSRAPSDTEFDPDQQSDEDDEETIEQEEATLGGAEQKEEIEALQKESQMELDDLLEDDLLRNYLLNRDKIKMSESEDSDDEKDKADEESDESESSKEEDCDDTEEESEDEIKTSNTATQGEHNELKLLVEDSQKEGEIKTEKDTKDDLINDAAAIAESIQPKGNTLSSTNVSTNIPFLLKYSLREYQHIGLDWLVTMFERKLNGILADEMGLGKTIQTIALLAHLACEKENWGPHLIVVPTSVMLNWEMECKKWCPAFKILTYYGSQKERKFKRIGWTKPNAFHICITSYKLVIQDHQSFRRKKWKYLILDEAQNIKNFKSQRWQLLLNFQTQQRLLLTGTPLQNNLMELWSLMHFLMPNVFQSHREFKEWFSNPVTGMIEGNSEYNESIIKRLHKVLRPFLLRRLKSEVEKQMPKKYEHVVMCRLSKRQRYLYDDYMSRAKTRETLAGGNLLSVINILMQLRKVCNHPNLFEIRPTISPFQCEGINLHIPSIVYSALDYDFTKHINLKALNLLLIMQEIHFGSYQCYRMRQSRNSKKIIDMEKINTKNPPPCPPCKLAMRVLPDKSINSDDKKEMPILTPSQPPPLQLKGIGQANMKVKVSGVQLVNPQGILKTIPVVNISQGSTGQIGTPVSVTSVLRPPDNKISASFAQLVQTSTGKHLLLTSNPNITANIPVTSTTSGGQKLTFLSKQPVSTIGNAGHSVTKAYVKFQLTSVTTASTFTTVTTANSNTISVVKSDDNKTKGTRTSVGIDYIGKLYSKQNTLDVRWNSDEKNLGIINDDDPKGERKNRLALMAKINKIRCSALPLYGRDFQDAVKIFNPNKINVWDGGSIHCLNTLYNKMQTDNTDCLKDMLYNPERRLEDLKDTFDRFIFYVPAVKAVEPELQVWHPPPSKYWGQKQDKQLLQKLFLKPATSLHSIASAMVTQFPDPRLIQYDCGKLQTLDVLLRKLKPEGHRALIFTQMTKMLDVLEAFLNYHGHIYLRLDGTTKVDQRQVLMERFNGDKRIFAFILSTRSGGVGVNLTGADTVIFYDSDWNPTMDAQAQDRCHRIGQTRDVHIYRLVSERTIEENILKKANQKRLLGDLAIEGGNFTTAYFKSSTIQDLFNIDQTEENAAARMSEVMEIKRGREKALSGENSTLDDKVAVGALENALAACEDAQDVQAAKTAKAEAVADLAEFDENIPLDEQEKEKEPEVSKAEQEINSVIEKLTPIEKYAMKFIEATESAWSAEQLAAAEREIEEQKREWEQNRLAAMREEEERRARELEEEGDLITFSREDATNQVSSKTKKLNRTSRSLHYKERKGRIVRKLGLLEGKQVKKLNVKRKVKEVQQEISEIESESSRVEESQTNSDSELTDEIDEDSSESKNISNHVDHNSPRTRSRGTVAINLWTLDVSPILPGEKPMRKQGENNRKHLRRCRSVSEDDNDSQPDSDTNKLLANKKKRRRKNHSSLEHLEDNKIVLNPEKIITKGKDCKVVLSNIMHDKRFKIPEILDEIEISVQLDDDNKQKQNVIHQNINTEETLNKESNIIESNKEAKVTVDDNKELDESILNDCYDAEFETKEEEEVDEVALLEETLDEISNVVSAGEEEIDKVAVLEETLDDKSNVVSTGKEEVDEVALLEETLDEISNVVTAGEETLDEKSNDCNNVKNDNKESIDNTLEEEDEKNKDTRVDEDEEKDKDLQENVKNDELQETDAMNFDSKEQTPCAEQSGDLVFRKDLNNETNDSTVGVHEEIVNKSNEDQVLSEELKDAESNETNMEIQTINTQIVDLKSDEEVNKSLSSLDGSDGCSHDLQKPTTDLESPKENIINNKNHVDNGVTELSKIPTIVTINRNANFRSPESRRKFNKFGRYSNNRTLDGWVKRTPPVDRFNYGRPDSRSDRPDNY